MYIPKLENVRRAAQVLKDVISDTPLQESLTYSDVFGANVYFKREDLHTVRSYKIRGAYNKIFSLSQNEKDKGIVCASAGNHAQGVSFCCKELQIKGAIFMPVTTPRQKVNRVKRFGGNFSKVILQGDTFDDSYKIAMDYCQKNQKVFVHPFDDEKIIEGQATVALEILNQIKSPIDYLITPVGGGGLASGLCAVFDKLSPKTKIIGVEPQGAPSMTESIKNNRNIKLKTIDKFIDGAAVQKVGDKNFSICQKYIHKMLTVPEGKVCQTILDMYNIDAIVVEPAGGLSVAALDELKPQIKGKNVVCIISGSNNDIARMAEIKERALLFKKIKHYFIIIFPQRAGALREFVEDVIGPTDDITYFEYQKKHSKENSPAIVGIELKHPKDLESLIDRMKKRNFFGEYLNEKPDLLSFLV